MTAINEPDVRFLFDLSIPMRDGVNLSADVFLPEKEGRYPVILQRTPYDNTSPLWQSISVFFAKHDYVFVSQDVRGRCDSDGEFEPLMNEDKDGYDTIEWIAAQPWCDGKVGMMGGSYGGHVQWMAARERPPHLVTLVSTASPSRWMQEFPFMNGKIMPYSMWWLNLVGGRNMQHSLAQFGTGSNKALLNWKKLLRHRPLRTLDQAIGRNNTVWQKWLDHMTYDDYWRQLALDDYYPLIDLPVLHITGWYDGDQWGELNLFKNMVAHSPASGKQFLLSGPWTHAGTRTPQAELGGVNFTQAAVLDINEVHLRWFDYWLKGKQNGQEEEPRVKIFTMGRNEWRDEPAWPLPGTQMTPYYFHSGGRANTLGGDGRLAAGQPEDEPADSYTYNPDDATPTVPDLDNFPLGDFPLDHRFTERRDDVLVYTSDVLEEEVEVTGTPFVVLYAASDAVDTDFAAVFTDVHPDGRSVPLTEGILRTSYRESLVEPTLIEPGKVYEYKIELMATSNAFLPGHRIRVSIMSARFPDWNRNPNTGAPIGDDEEFVLAHQTVFHNEVYPSHLLLPVILRRKVG